MVKSKKPAKAKKKTKAKTTRKDGSVRTSKEAAERIKEIAETLYRDHVETLRDMEIFRPSAKLAIDYLLSVENDTAATMIQEQTPQNNLYDDMISIERGGE